MMSYQRSRRIQYKLWTTHAVLIVMLLMLVLWFFLFFFVGQNDAPSAPMDIASNPNWALGKTDLVRGFIAVPILVLFGVFCVLALLISELQDHGKEMEPEIAANKAALALQRALSAEGVPQPELDTALREVATIAQGLSPGEIAIGEKEGLSKMENVFARLSPRDRDQASNAVRVMLSDIAKGENRFTRVRRGFGALSIGHRAHLFLASVLCLLSIALFSILFTQLYLRPFPGSGRFNPGIPSESSAH